MTDCAGALKLSENFFSRSIDILKSREYDVYNIHMPNAFIRDRSFSAQPFQRAAVRCEAVRKPVSLSPFSSPPKAPRVSRPERKHSPLQEKVFDRVACPMPKAAAAWQQLEWYRGAQGFVSRKETKPFFVLFRFTDQSAPAKGAEVSSTVFAHPANPQRVCEE